MTGGADEAPGRGESDAAAEATGEADAETVRANFNVPEPLHARFKHLCKSEGRDIPCVIKKLMRQYVRERGGT